MSSSSDLQSTRGALEELPTFELGYGLDDPEDPSEVTVYAPEADALATSWITIDVGHAVPLEEVA